MDGLPPPRYVFTANWLMHGNVNAHRTVHRVPKQSIWSSSRTQELRFWPSEMNCQLNPSWGWSNASCRLEWVTSRWRGPIWNNSLGSMYILRCPLVHSRISKLYFRGEWLGFRRQNFLGWWRSFWIPDCRDRRYNERHQSGCTNVFKSQDTSLTD